MWHAILMFGGKNNEIIYPNPGFPIYESVINYSGAKAVPIRLDSKNDFNINVVINVIPNNINIFCVILS